MNASQYFDWHDKLFTRLLMASRRLAPTDAAFVGVQWGRWIERHRVRMLESR